MEGEAMKIDTIEVEIKANVPNAEEMIEELIKRTFKRLVKEHILTPLDAMTLEEYFIKYAKEEMK